MRNKNLYRIVLILGFIIINALILFGISQVIAYLNTGADTSKIYRADIKTETYYTPIFHWNSIENPGRKLLPETQKKIARDYKNAWYVKNLAFKTFETQPLHDHYTKKAVATITEQIKWNAKNNIQFETTTLTHNVSLELLSADGKLAVLRDDDVRIFTRQIVNNSQVFKKEETASFRVILLLEDGFWKIRHIEKIPSNKKENSFPLATLPKTTIKGINYYPQNSPWGTFGDHFSEETLQNDFQKIKGLGLNTIRVFVGYEDFGKAHVSEEKIEKLMTLLSIANENKLQVLITFFDFYGDYAVMDWPQTHVHVSKIIKKIQNHPAVLAYDIKNEPDLDFKNRGDELVTAWLSSIIKTIKQHDRVHPVTIGWSSAKAARILENEVDYISFHYYQDIENLSNTVSEIQNATSKTVVVEEFGMSTNTTFWNPFSNSEEDQYTFYESFFEQQKRDSINYLSWTLYDFPDIPNKVVGSSPWKKHRQKHFGLYKISGTKKKAVSLFKK